MDNVPYGTAFEDLLPLVFPADHPYGHLPIGNMAHLAAATLDEVSEFHARYYMPNNAVLTIVGDVAEARRVRPGRALSRRHHRRETRPNASCPTPLPPVAVPARRRADRGRAGARRAGSAAGCPPTSPAPGSWRRSSSPARILGEGETSRLYRRLVREDELALSAGLGVNTLVAGNSLGVASVRAVPGRRARHRRGRRSRRSSHRFASDGPTELELAIARAQAERGWLDEMATAGGRADALSGCALLYDDPEALNDRLAAHPLAHRGGGAGGGRTLAGADARRPAADPPLRTRRP